MVIMHGIEDRPSGTTADILENGSPYVYLVDNEEQMMLIVKNDLNEIGKNVTAAPPPSMQEFISGKVQHLLEKVNSNGPLSQREMQVLQYAAMGKSNKQIAETIGISESTVKNHFSSTLRKLNASDRTHAVVLAVYHGWINVRNLSNLFKSEVPVAEALGY